MKSRKYWDNKFETYGVFITLAIMLGFFILNPVRRFGSKNHPGENRK